MTKPALHRPRAGSGKAASPVDLVARLLDTPHLPAVVRSLDAETLHRLVRSSGLGDCGEIVALATPEQLQEVLDLDLWRPDPRGRAERFDIGRFGAWLEVLVEVGVETAAQTMMALDSSLVAAALMEHVHLVERTWTPTRAVERLLESGPSVEIGGITIVARRSDAWDALVALFDHLGGEHPHYFHELVRACRDVSIREAMFEEDGFEVLRPAAQLLADAAFDRDLRRDVRGYVTPADAAAFLEASRRIALSGNQAPGRDVLTSSYFRDLDHDFRLKPEATGRAASQAEATGRALNEGRAVFYHTLREAGVVADVHRPLLSDGGMDQEPYARLRAAMEHAGERDPLAPARRQEELGYLANVLAAGCSFDSRGFSAAEAFNAAAAVCNLGLENWPRQWGVESDLTTVFRVGWTVLHEHVGVRVPRRLIEILMALEFADAEMRDDMRVLCEPLRRELAAGTPWRVRDHLDAIAILDPPSWAILVRLIDECPAVPRDGLGSAVPPRPVLRHSTEYHCISENRQIAWALAFVESLPGRLLS